MQSCAQEKTVNGTELYKNIITSDFYPGLPHIHYVKLSVACILWSHYRIQSAV